MGRSPDLKLEVVAVPVSDVERAKRFYSGHGYAEYRVREQSGGDSSS